MAHATGPDDGAGETTRHTAGAFDIRTFIAALMGIFGVILILAGIFGADKTTDGSKTAGNVNLTVGISILVFGALMEGWALWRPTIVDEAELARDRAAAEEGPPAH
jgi:arginine exporter protein ArgO